MATFDPRSPEAPPDDRAALRARLTDHLAAIREALESTLSTCGDIYEQAAALQRLDEIEAYIAETFVEEERPR